MAILDSRSIICSSFFRFRCLLSRVCGLCSFIPFVIGLLNYYVLQCLVLFIGTLNSNLKICQYTASGQILGGQAGCYNLVPVFDWIQRCIISIFLVFMISFLPLFLQDMATNFLMSSSLIFYF